MFGEVLATQVKVTLWVTVSVRVALPVPPLLVALSVTAKVPAVVGVPEIKPVAVFTNNPEGNPVAP
jgi:hypothetical protein